MRSIGLPEIIVILGVFITSGFALVLLIGALRWKQSRSVQRALIDKLGSGNEVAAFLQTPSGAQFLRGIAESESPGRTILASVRRGIVVLVVGLGLALLGVFTRVADAVPTIGIVLMFLGAGLLAAAYISYHLARRWKMLAEDSHRED
ncbi:MAG TPA: hypothetical protein VN442_03765 [Bryobacteraceae bacterium]|nr:hypothetical protein [Bryobacteraceae bacterium]